MDSFDGSVIYSIENVIMDSYSFTIGIFYVVHFYGEVIEYFFIY